MFLILNLGDYMEDEELYLNNKDGKILKNFSVDNKTLGKIKKFMKEYNRDNFSKSILDLVNLGLANLGYIDKGKAVERFAIDDKFPDVDFQTILKSPKQTVYGIIKTLSQKSLETNAHRTQILLEARGKGLSNKKTTDMLDLLKRSGEIYEPMKDNFKIAEC
jgi:hypothetical protein